MDSDKDQCVVPGQKIDLHVGSHFPKAPNFILGTGVYMDGGSLYASLAGTLQYWTMDSKDSSFHNDTSLENLGSAGDDSARSDKDAPKIFVQVVSSSSALSSATEAKKRQITSPIPQIGQTVLGTVAKVTAKHATVAIQIILLPDGLSGASSTNTASQNLLLAEPFKGTLRQQDIFSHDNLVLSKNTLGDSSSTSTSHIPVINAVRPGDLVRAKVIGLGDATSGFWLSTEADPNNGVMFAKCAVSGEPMIPIAWNEMACPKTGIRERRKCARPAQVVSE